MFSTIFSHPAQIFQLACMLVAGVASLVWSLKWILTHLYQIPSLSCQVIYYIVGVLLVNIIMAWFLIILTFAIFQTFGMTLAQDLKTFTSSIVFGFFALFVYTFVIKQTILPLSLEKSFLAALISLFFCIGIMWFIVFVGGI